MVLSVEDRHAITVIYQEKWWTAERILQKFLARGWKRSTVRDLIAKLQETGSSDRRYEVTDGAALSSAGRKLLEDALSSPPFLLVDHGYRVAIFDGKNPEEEQKIMKFRFDFFFFDVPSAERSHFVVPTDFYDSYLKSCVMNGTFKQKNNFDDHTKFAHTGEK